MASKPARLADTELPALDLSIPPWPGRKVRVGDAEIFVRTTPSAAGAEPALFVHGLGGASTNWTDFAAQLAPWLAIECLDLPGFGRSAEAPARDYSIGAHKRTVVRYLEQSGRGPVHLVGNSMGGLISILIAARRPDLVRSLTVISPAVPDLRPRRLGTDPLLAVALLPGTAPLVRRRIRRFTPEQRARAIINLCFAQPSEVPPHRITEAANEVRARDDMHWATEALIRSLRGLVGTYFVRRSRGVWERMSTIEAPSLVVWGARDRLVDPALAPRVAETIPDARLLVLDDIGHVAQLEDPVTTARAMLALLEDLPAEAPGLDATPQTPAVR
jgi:pimeloyl-ACP methyl ester carboxylesterase